LFDLYGVYKESIKPKVKKSKNDYFIKENKELWDRVCNLETELATIQNVCDIYFQEEKSFKEKIEVLEVEKSQL